MVAYHHKVSYHNLMCFLCCWLKAPGHLELTAAHVRITVAIRVPLRHTLIVAQRRTAFRVDDFTKLVVLLKPRVKQHIFAGDSLVGISAQKRANDAASF